MKLNNSCHAMIIIHNKRRIKYKEEKEEEKKGYSKCFSVNVFKDF